MVAELPIRLNRFPAEIVSRLVKTIEGDTMKKICMFLAAIASSVDARHRVRRFRQHQGHDTATASGTATSKSSPTATAGAMITIENMAFGQPLTVAPGVEITIANNDSVEHSVTSDTAGAFEVDVDGKKKGTLIAPTQPGEYPFHCSYHPYMKGTLIVK